MASLGVTGYILDSQCTYLTGVLVVITTHITSSSHNSHLVRMVIAVVRTPDMLHMICIQ